MCGGVGSILAGEWSGRLALRFCGFVVYKNVYFDDLNVFLMILI